jgi:membrane associated rhomboid family serine protease
VTLIGGTAFFAHAGGFIFGLMAASALVRSVRAQRRWQPVA